MNSTTYLDTICPTGRYCPENTTDSEQYRCPAGSFNPSEGATSIIECISCTAGLYCQGEGNSQPTSNCRFVMTVCNERWLDGCCCMQAVFYSEGWYCSGGAVQPMPTDISQGGACDLGEYCPGGSDTPIPCDGGMFCSRARLALPTGPCQQGEYQVT